MFGNVNIERAAQKMSGGVVNLMVGYLFVLYKVDKPRKKVRAVLSVRFQ